MKKEVDSTVFDRWTHIDNLLKELIKAVKDIPSQETQITITGESLLGQLVEMKKAEMERELNIYFFTYPRDGTHATLTAGTWDFDWEAGTITSPTGAVTQMSTNLDAQKKDFLRSIFVDVDVAAVIQLDGSDKIPIDYGKNFLATYMQFKVAKITVAESAEISMLVCSNPEAILQLLDRPSLTIAGVQGVYGTKEDFDHTNDYFETDQAITDTPTLYMTLLPATVKKFELESVSYYMEADNASAYRLYLLQAAKEDDIESLMSIVFDSGAAKASSTHYAEIASNKLPILCNLATAGRLYYLIDWVTAPTTVKGFIKIGGERRT